MLDNSLVMFVNTCGGSHHRGQNNHPVVMIGGAGRRAQGRALPHVPRGQALPQRLLRRRWRTCWTSPITTFGDPSVCKGPLPGLA